MKRGLFIVMFATGIAILCATTEDLVQPAYETAPEALGFQGGEIGGTGLSFQTWRGRTGYQFAFGGIYVPYVENEPSLWNAIASTTLDYVVGAEIQSRVYGEAYTRWLSGQLYVFAGLNHRGYIPLVDSGESFRSGSYTPVLGVGAGIGIEIILFGHFSIPVELGYGLKWTPTITVLADQFEVNLMPQAGFRYRY